jgi:hypothetical protein
MSLFDALMSVCKGFKKGELVILPSVKTRIRTYSTLMIDEFDEFEHHDECDCERCNVNFDRE